MKKIFAVFLLIFLISCAKNSEKNFSEILIDNGENLIKINAEIADDNEERAKGLMFRETLENQRFSGHRKSKGFSRELNENSGMFFIFEDEDYQTFWMKNTLIPLDIIFIDNNFKIVDIKYAVPCREDSCELYKSSKPAKYVLEVNENFTTKNNIKIGDRIIAKRK